ncbi:MAG: hypothetical protein MRY78_19960 [Saprospiraceae bacterium]|nr:hypothetical protein [Saprospiraceae bacterium]
MENNKAKKTSLRARIANIIVIVPSQKNPKDKESSVEDRKRKHKFDLIAMILKIIATLIAIFKLFK